MREFISISDKKEIKATQEELDELDKNPHPIKRSECLPGGRNEMRPCPYVSCRHHLGIDINKAGAITIFDNWEDKETCALDVADHGGTNLELMGELLNVTRERARQLETTAEAGLICGLWDLGMVETEDLERIMDRVRNEPVYQEEMAGVDPLLKK